MFPHPRVGRQGADDEDVPEPSSSAAGAQAEAGASGSAGGSAGSGASGERLSLMELVVAELGGWAGAIFYRCHLPAGPFLVSDGVVHIDLAVFHVEMREHGEPSAPE